MRCPFCGFEDTKVIDSRTIDLKDSRPSDSKKRRRRECTNCQKRFTTYESVERPLVIVRKKDGSFEPFSRNKLITGNRKINIKIRREITVQNRKPQNKQKIRAKNYCTKQETSKQTEP